METHTAPSAPIADKAFTPAPVFATRRQACQRLGVGKTKLGELIADGKLPRIKFGGKALIPLADIDRLIAELIADAAAAAPAEAFAQVLAPIPANASHATKRAATLAAIAEHPDLGNREIARQLGVSHTYVSNLRRAGGAK